MQGRVLLRIDKARVEEEREQVIQIDPAAHMRFLMLRSLEQSKKSALVFDAHVQNNDRPPHRLLAIAFLNVPGADLRAAVESKARCNLYLDPRDDEAGEEDRALIIFNHGKPARRDLFYFETYSFSGQWMIEGNTPSGHKRIPLTDQPVPPGLAIEWLKHERPFPP